MSRLQFFFAISGLFILINLTACASNKKLETTDYDCYKIEGITEDNFLLNDDKTIVPLELGCKKGYFITKIRQKPQINPEDFSQYIIVDEITCCSISPKKD